MSQAATQFDRARNRRQLDSLRESWEEVKRWALERLEKRRREQAGQWGASFAALRTRYLDLRASGQWVSGPSDFLGVLGRSRSELDHSCLLRWLLDPCMRHGLGSALLENILCTCFPEDSFAEPSAATARCEVTRGSGRLDILVEAPTWTLVIENKVDAPESDGQLDGYYEQYNREPGVRFIFLTPKGRRGLIKTPAAAEAYVSLSYAQVARALNDALEATREDAPGAGRLVASDYLQSLERVFGLAPPLELS